MGHRYGGRRWRGSFAGAWLSGKSDFLVTVIYLVIICLFGGGLVDWGFSYIALALATIVMAVALAWRDGFVVFCRVPLAGRIALAGIALLPLLQLVPLPPTLWQALPGQDLRRATLGLVGIADSWQPMSLDPVGTALCAVMAIGFVAFVGWLMRLSDIDYRRLLSVAFLLVVLNILVGLSQVVTDGQFPQIQADNMGATLLGFYANKNHMALALACSILLFGLVISRDGMARDRRVLAGIGYTVFALVAIVTTNSRAGLALGALAAAIVLFDLGRGIALRWRIVGLAVIGLLAVAIMSSSAFEQVSGRVDDVSSDLRWRFTTWSWPLAKQFWELGSGAGSFLRLFAAHEQLGWLMPTFVNAVHNDYLQLVIEYGVPGTVLLAMLMLSLAQGAGAFRQLSRHDPHHHEMLFGLSVLMLFALHSIVDYPLRRPAAWAFFALALAAVYRGQGVDGLRDSEPKRRKMKPLDG